MLIAAEALGIGRVRDKAVKYANDAWSSTGRSA